MTVKDVLDILDDETWLCILLPDGGDICVWGAGWIGGDHLPEDLWAYLDWDADDMCVEQHKDPERGTSVWMVRVTAYERGSQCRTTG